MEPNPNPKEEVKRRQAVATNTLKTKTAKTENYGWETIKRFYMNTPVRSGSVSVSVRLNRVGRFYGSSTESESREEEAGEDLEAINEQTQEGYICLFGSLTFFNRI